MEVYRSAGVSRFCKQIRCLMPRLNESSTDPELSTFVTLLSLTLMLIILQPCILIGIDFNSKMVVIDEWNTLHNNIHRTYICHASEQKRVDECQCALYTDLHGRTNCGVSLIGKRSMPFLRNNHVGHQVLARRNTYDRQCRIYKHHKFVFVTLIILVHNRKSFRKTP